MRTLVFLTTLGAAWAAEPELGTWKMNAARSTFHGETQPKSLTVRIELHAKGEVFTLERIEADGRASSSSTVLYLDGTRRDFQDSECSGTQSSRRLGSYAVEIDRSCKNGAWVRVVRQLSTQHELTLDVTEQRPDGRRFEQRLVLRKER